jgi:hypothetical protein
MRFQQPGMPQGYNPSSSPQQQAAGASGAKWHIPQQQQPRESNQNGFGGMMNNPSSLGQFPGQDTFKIPLKSPETMRNSNGSNSSPMGPPLPNVSSTNPKTPSPSRNDVSFLDSGFLKDFY